MVRGVPLQDARDATADGQGASRSGKDGREDWRGTQRSGRGGRWPRCTTAANTIGEPSVILTSGVYNGCSLTRSRLDWRKTVKMLTDLERSCMNASARLVPVYHRLRRSALEVTAH